LARSHALRRKTLHWPEIPAKTLGRQFVGEGEWGCAYQWHGNHGDAQNLRKQFH
jgi:hypothetical protein